VGRGLSVPEQVTVLVVEDEPSFVDALVVGLQREGFRVEVAHDGDEALDKFSTVRPDLVLLDIMLPRVSGIDVCRAIRARGNRMPIIMVTAKTSEIDTVVGLEVGADDYVTKPYRLRELVARMRAVLRRSPLEERASEQLEVLNVGNLRLDSERHEVYIGDKEVVLPLKEFDLLELFMTNAGRVLTRDSLIDRIWGPHYGGDTKTLDVHVNRLRARIEDDPSHPRRITTIRGLGYKLELVQTEMG
jgi:two-component system response regulator RegX3